MLLRSESYVEYGTLYICNVKTVELRNLTYHYDALRFNGEAKSPFPTV
jgi:hypothetical protein